MDKYLEIFGELKIREVVEKSNSYSDVMKNLNLDYKNDSIKNNIKRTIKRMCISVDHFETIKRITDSKVRWNKDKLNILVNKHESYKDILEELDLLPVTTNYDNLKKYLNKFNINYDKLKIRKRYTVNVFDWENKDLLNSIIKNSKTQKEALEKMQIRSAGGNINTLKKYIKIYDIDISHFSKNYENMVNFTISKKIPLVDILVENSTYCRSLLKKRLYEDGLKEKYCEKCGQGEDWFGEHMSLILDHANGVHDDNRLFNLRILCPNCNATLDTHCGKNKSKHSKKLIENGYKINDIVNFNLVVTPEKVKSYINRRIVERPSYSDLLNEIKINGLEGVGRKYGVTGTAVKKWVKTYEKYNI